MVEHTGHGCLAEGKRELSMVGKQGFPCIGSHFLGLVAQRTKIPRPFLQPHGVEEWVGNLSRNF